MPRHLEPTDNTHTRTELHYQLCSHGWSVDDIMRGMRGTRVNVVGGAWIKEGDDLWRGWVYPAGSPVKVKTLTPSEVHAWWLKPSWGAVVMWRNAARMPDGSRSNQQRRAIDLWFEQCEKVLHEIPA